VFVITFYKSVNLVNKEDEIGFNLQVCSNTYELIQQAILKLLRIGINYCMEIRQLNQNAILLLI